MVRVVQDCSILTMNLDSYSFIWFNNEKKYFELCLIFGWFTEGVSLPIQCASDPISQATNYNGYHHDTMIMKSRLSSISINLCRQ